MSASSTKARTSQRPSRTLSTAMSRVSFRHSTRRATVASRPGPFAGAAADAAQQPPPASEPPAMPAAAMAGRSAPTDSSVNPLATSAGRRAEGRRTSAPSTPARVSRSVRGPAPRLRASVAPRRASASGQPSLATVSTKISGSMVGEAIQNDMTGASGTPASRSPLTTGITVHEQKGLKAPTAVASAMDAPARAERRERGGLDVVVGEEALAGGVHEPRLAQQAQVVRDRRLLHRQRVLEVAHAHLAAPPGQDLEQAQTHGVREHVEVGGGPLEGLVERPARRHALAAARPAAALRGVGSSERSGHGVLPPRPAAPMNRSLSI